MKNPRKSGKFYGLRFQYRYCTNCDKIYVPLKPWAIANRFTLSQCRTLLKRGWLVGLKDKGRLYVATNVEDIRKEYDYG